MIGSTTRILALAAMSMAMTARAVPPPSPQGGGSATATAGLGAQQGSSGILAFLAPTAESAAGGLSQAGAAASSVSPATAFESNAAAPDTKELIEAPGAGKSFGWDPEAPIPKMPAFTVTGAQVPEFRERDLNSRVGMAAVAFKRHPGLLVGNAFNLNARIAREMFLADDWRSTKSDYSNMAWAMARGGDPAEGRMILQAVRDEDEELRAAGGDDSGLPAFDRLQVGHLESDSKLLQAPEDPVDIPFLRVKW